MRSSHAQRPEQAPSERVRQHLRAACDAFSDELACVVTSEPYRELEVDERSAVRTALLAAEVASEGLASDSPRSSSRSSVRPRHSSVHLDAGQEDRGSADQSSSPARYNDSGAAPKHEEVEPPAHQFNAIHLDEGADLDVHVYDLDGEAFASFEIDRPGATFQMVFESAGALAQIIRQLEETRERWVDHARAVAEKDSAGRR